MTGGRRPVIRTPDQRIRVFVSSTLRELEEERRAVRDAIESLRLAPVMFELGARPHPPRELYRSYLAQSDVFVGIYAASYGWVAPDEDVSGLEDEYDLAPSEMPKLIYLKSVDERDDRLNTLIDRIRERDDAAYKSFTTAEELRELVVGDLAILLTERFTAMDDATGERAESGETEPATPPRSGMPTPYTRLIGREESVDELLRLIDEPATRLITLTGPGGIGKSRLAIEVATRAASRFPDGVAFVPLENVLEPRLILPAIGYALGVSETGLALEERLAIALDGRRMLIVLDNFEQLIDEARLLPRLFAIAPDATFLVTSRRLLRVRGERAFDVPPLSTGDPDAPGALSRARTASAVELFIERARSARPEFDTDDTNLSAVVEICRVLGGLPLAIELAAARTRALAPVEILERLDRQLPLLTTSARDMPERQRTLRATITWSTDLLTHDQHRLLDELCVFSPGFTLESVEALGMLRGWDFDPIEELGELVDSSLAHQEEVSGEAVFSFLVSVREYGIERLVAAGTEAAVRDAHAAVYTELARTQAVRLGTGDQLDAVSRLTLERSNLRAGVRHLVAVGDLDGACDLAWRLFLFWWAGGYILEVAGWLQIALASAGDDASPRARAVTAFYSSWRDMWGAARGGISQILRQVAAHFEDEGDPMGVAIATTTAGVAEINGPSPDVPAAAGWLRAGGDAFRALGCGWGECLALVALGRIALLSGRPEEAAALFDRAADASAASGERFAGTVALHHVGRAHLAAGRLGKARDAYLASMSGSVALRHIEGIAYCLEGLSAVAAEVGDIERAGRLAGAAAAIRRHTAAFDAPAFEYHRAHLERLRARDPDALEAAERRGAELGAFEAARYAREPLPALGTRTGG